MPAAIKIPVETFAMLAGLPGEELIVPGLRDLEAGHLSTPEALLLLMARTRLVRAGFTFLSTVDPFALSPESLLYQALRERKPESAYADYNSLKRRLDSFIRSLESRVSGRPD